MVSLNEKVHAPGAINSVVILFRWLSDTHMIGIVDLESSLLNLAAISRNKASRSRAWKEPNNVSSAVTSFPKAPDDGASPKLLR
jgi:hypothetical protein